MVTHCTISAETGTTHEVMTTERVTGGSSPDGERLREFYNGLSSIEQLVSKLCHILFHSLGPILPQSNLLCFKVGVLEMVNLKILLQICFA